MINTELTASLPLAATRSSGAADRPKALQQAAQDFEAMMIEQMLKSMRKANEVLEEDSLTGSREQTFWQEWQDSTLAVEMARGQGTGLAQAIIRQVEALES